MEIPSKRECFYVLEMIQAGLIDFSYVQPWADTLIAEIDTVPPWLGDLALKQYRGDLVEALRAYVFSEPFEAGPEDMEKFHVACLWLRYERRELSWATFLRLAGDLLDNVSGDWACETPYYYLNLYRDAYFSVAAEEQTKKDYLSEQDLRPWIELAKEKFEPFRRLKSVCKVHPSAGSGTDG